MLEHQDQQGARLWWRVQCCGCPVWDSHRHSVSASCPGWCRPQPWSPLALHHLTLCLCRSMTCKETDKETPIVRRENARKLRCNIDGGAGKTTQINHLSEGVMLVRRTQRIAVVGDHALSRAARAGCCCATIRRALIKRLSTRARCWPRRQSGTPRAASLVCQSKQ